MKIESFEIQIYILKNKTNLIYWQVIINKTKCVDLKLDVFRKNKIIINMMHTKSLVTFPI